MTTRRSILQSRGHLRPPTDDLLRRYEKLGLWREQSIGAFVDENLHANARSPVRFWAERGYVGTAADVRERARRFAGGLVAAGGGRPGDVVSYQLTNRVEALIVLYGAAMAGGAGPDRAFLRAEGGHVHPPAVGLDPARHRGEAGRHGRSFGRGSRPVGG